MEFVYAWPYDTVHADAARRALIVSQEQAVQSGEAQLDTALANSQAAPRWQANPTRVRRKGGNARKAER